MKIAIAVLTYRRSKTLETMLKGLEKHCRQHTTAVFEDCGQRDDTARILQQGRTPTYRPEYMAFQYYSQGDPEQIQNGFANFPFAHVFMGERNLGVAGNSNRALHWFMTETDADYLMLCNDDLHVEGDFAAFYATGSKDLGVEHFCFCDFTHHPSYKWTTYKVRGYGVKFMPRFTGIMLMFTRKLLERVGYFDAQFTQFGQEHCDMTIRCRFAGGVKLDGQDMNCLDLEHTLLRHQECGTSVTGPERDRANTEADAIMRQCSEDYRWRHYHRPYRLALPRLAGGYSGGGIPVTNLLDCGYRLVTDLAR